MIFANNLRRLVAKCKAVILDMRNALRYNGKQVRRGVKPPLLNGATVPANTTATFLLPAEGGTFTVNGKEESALNNCDGIVCLGRENGAVRFESSCGVFRFVRRA